MLIRNAEPADAERLLEIYSYYVTDTAVSFEIEVPSLKEFENRIVNISAKYPYLVLEEEGIIQGYAYAGPFKTRAAYDHCVEVTVYVDHLKKGCGYGRALYETLEKALKKQGILNLYACIGVPASEDEYLTDDSERFHAHLGF